MPPTNKERLESWAEAYPPGSLIYDRRDDDKQQKEREEDESED